MTSIPGIPSDEILNCADTFPLSQQLIYEGQEGSNIEIFIKEFVLMPEKLRIMFHNFQFLNRFSDIPLDQVGQCKLQKFNRLSRMPKPTFDEICKFLLQKLHSHDMIIYKSLDKTTFHGYSNTPSSTGELLL